MRPSSQDLREWIRHAVQSQDESQAAVAQRFAVSRSFVERLWQRWRQTGSCAARPHDGARVEYLPPYSPDCNPIEQGESKLKTPLRQRKARTRRALERGLAALLPTTSSTDAQAWFRHCGYPPH